MKQHIKSITEAFSQTPNYFYVTIDEPEYVESRKFHVKRIEEIIEQTSENDRTTYYIGWDWNENIMFKYIAATVNVTYYYTEK